MKLYRPVGAKTLVPVGIVVFTATKTNPSTWFGGTWEQLYGGYLYLCADSAEKTNYTGLNTQSTTLQESQIPSHSHTASCSDVGNHNHGYESQKKRWADSPISSAGSVLAGTGAQSNYAVYYYTDGGGAHGHTVTIGSTGGGGGHSHNIATVGFFAWKRTA